MPITPNFESARRLLDAIAGRPDYPATFQVFDDKGAQFDIAGWRFGRLRDAKIRAWLLHKSKQGCGIFFVINECDGKGRRRENVKTARAAFVDFDGEPLPDLWPVDPDVIVESSPGRFHAYWLIEPTEDLNAWSDLQKRLATFYGGDPKVFDPPRVLRLPGFDHKKSDPFRVKFVKDFVPETFQLGTFSRNTLENLANLHPCDYQAPRPRENGGRSETPEGGWDQSEDLLSAVDYLQNVDVPAEGNRNNEGYRVACVLNDLGISPETSEDLMQEHWNPRLDPPLPDHEIKHVCKSATRYKANSAGVESFSHVKDDFADADDTTTPDDLTAADFEGNDSVKKTIVRNSGGLKWSFANEIKPERLEWLWPDRFPKGKPSILAGYPDQGKSQIMLSIAATITTGGQWPDGSGTAEKGLVFILSSEDDAADTLLPRLEAAGADTANVIILQSMVTEVVTGRKVRRVLNIQDDLAKLSSMIKTAEESRELKCKLVGLDPMNAYFGGSKTADSHNAAEMRALLTPLSEWCGRYRIALLGIMHFNKSGNAHTLYSVNGSGSITAAARSVYFALRDMSIDEDAEIERLFVPGKHNLAPDAIKGLSYSIDSKLLDDPAFGVAQRYPFVVWGNATGKSAEQALGQRKERVAKVGLTIRDWIIDFLDKGPKTAAEMNEAAVKIDGFSASTFATIRGEMKREGRIAYTGKGGVRKWTLVAVPPDEFPEDHGMADQEDDNSSDFDFG